MIHNAVVYNGGNKESGVKVKVTVEPGSIVTATDGITTLKETSDGSVIFNIPNYGQWTISAALDGESSDEIIIDILENYLTQINLKKFDAHLNPTQGVSYQNGFSGLKPNEVSTICNLISDNLAISSSAKDVYIDHGSIHRKISIGDRIYFKVNGVNSSFNLIGFNHDKLSDPAVYGNKTSTGKAGTTWQHEDLTDQTYKMHKSGHGIGWKNCDMRLSTLPKLLSSIDPEWSGIFKTVDKTTGIGNYTKTETEITKEKLFLLSEVEIYNRCIYSVPGEGMQYKWYAIGNPKKRKKQSSCMPTDPFCDWWERSPGAGNSYDFCYVGDNGMGYGYPASYDVCVSICFCI